KAGEGFTPTELLLVAIAGCSAVDVDVVTGRRSPADTFAARVDAEMVRDENGNRLSDIRLTFQITFPGWEAGDAPRQMLPRAARDMLPREAKVSHDRPCTGSRTIEAGTPITIQID